MREATSLIAQIKFTEQRDNARGSFANFVQRFNPEGAPARHHKYLIDKLDKVAKGEIKRLLIFMPPGSAKSTYSSILFPPYWLERNPGKLIIGASHSGDLAERFGRKVRNIVDSREYRDLFDTTLASDSKAAGRWETSKGSEYYAVGVRGSITGRRADIGLIDDPVKGRKEAESAMIQNDTWEWYLSDFRTRLKPDAAIVIIQTRWVEDDLSGRILPSDYAGESGPVVSDDGELWEVVNLPQEAREGDPLGREPGELLWPEWFSPDWVEQEKTILGPRNWNALHQQDPTPDAGDYYRREDFRWYKQAPKHLTIYMSGDYAVSEGEGDYSQVGVWGVDPDDNIYLLDLYKGQVNSLELVDALIDFNEKYEPMVSIGETGVIRRAIEPILKRRMREKKSYMRLEWLVHSEGNKPAMGRSFQAMVQQNRVYLPRTSWAEELLSELVKFPNGKYDDGADMCALFGRYINKVWSAKRPKPKAPPVVVEGVPAMTVGELIGMPNG